MRCRARVGRVRERSRWFNSLSVEATRAQLGGRAHPPVRARVGVRGALARSALGWRRTPCRAACRREPGDGYWPRPCHPAPAWPGYGNSERQLQMLMSTPCTTAGSAGWGCSWPTSTPATSAPATRSSAPCASPPPATSWTATPIPATPRPEDTLEHGQLHAVGARRLQAGQAGGGGPGRDRSCWRAPSPRPRRSRSRRTTGSQLSNGPTAWERTSSAPR